MTAGARFVQEMLDLVRRDFYAGRSDKRFFQERPTLIQAITWPARWLGDRGARPRRPEKAIAIFRRILLTVVGTIKKHGRPERIERFSVYLLHCVQAHLRFHGEDYYVEAKRADSIAELLPAPARLVDRRTAQVDPTDYLSQMNSVLGLKAGRKRRQAPADQMSLFGLSKLSKATATAAGAFVNCRWLHPYGDPLCACEFPRVWTAYPHECQNCMKLLRSDPALSGCRPSGPTSPDK